MEPLAAALSGPASSALRLSVAGAGTTRLWSEFLLDETLLDVHAVEMRAATKAPRKDAAVTGPTMRVLLQQLVQRYREQRENVRMQAGGVKDMTATSIAALRSTGDAEMYDVDDDGGAGVRESGNHMNGAAAAWPRANDDDEAEEEQQQPGLEQKEEEQEGNCDESVLSMRKRLLRSVSALILRTVDIILDEESGEQKEARGATESLATLRCLVPVHLLADLIQVFTDADEREIATDRSDGSEAEKPSKSSSPPQQPSPPPPSPSLALARDHLEVELALKRYMERALPECAAISSELRTAAPPGAGPGQHENMMMMVGNSLSLSFGDHASGQSRFNARTRLPTPPIDAMNRLSDFFSTYGGDNSPELESSDVGLGAATLAELLIAMSQPEKAMSVLDTVARTVRAANLPNIVQRINSLQNAAAFLRRSNAFEADGAADEASVRETHASVKDDALHGSSSGQDGELDILVEIEKSICDKEWATMSRLLRQNITAIASTTSPSPYPPPPSRSARDAALTASYRAGLVDDYRLPATTAACVQVSNIIHHVVSSEWSPGRAAMEFVDIRDRARVRSQQGDGSLLLHEELDKSMLAVDDSRNGEAKERCAALVACVDWLTSKRGNTSLITWSPLAREASGRRSSHDAGMSTPRVERGSNSSRISYDAVEKNLDALAYGIRGMDRASLDENVVHLNQRIVDACVDGAVLMKSETVSSCVAQTLEKDARAASAVGAVDEAVQMRCGVSTHLLCAFGGPMARGTKRKRETLADAHVGGSGTAGPQAMGQRRDGDDGGAMEVERAIAGGGDGSAAQTEPPLPLSITSDESVIVRFATMCVNTRTWGTKYKAKVLDIIVRSHDVSSSDGGTVPSRETGAAKSAHRKKKFLTTLVNCCDCLERCLEFAELLRDDLAKTAAPAHLKSLSTLYRILSSSSARDAEVAMLARLVSSFFSYKDLALLVAVIAGLMYKTSLLKDQYRSSRDIRFVVKVGVSVVKHMDWSQIEGTDAESRLRCVQGILEQAVSRLRTCISRSKSSVALGDESLLSQLALVEGDLERLRGKTDEAARHYTAACIIESRFGANATDAFSKEIGRKALLSIASSAFSRGALLSAVALCQCVTPVDFATAFKFLLQEPDRRKDCSLDRTLAASDAELSYLACIWELPIFERIVYAFTYESRSHKRHAHVALQQLRRSAGLNINNTAQRPAAIAARRRLLILLMMRDMLPTLCSEPAHAQTMLARLTSTPSRHGEYRC